MRKILLLLTLSSILTISDIRAEYDRKTPIVEAYKAVEGAVVNISGKQLVSNRPRSFMDFYNLFGPKRRRQDRYRRFELGSGLVVHKNGYIVTNAHVIKSADKLSVTFTNGDEYQAEIISADESKDLAFLKIDADKEFEPINMGSSGDLMIGETVIAVGNPFGYSNSVTEGIISAVGRSIHVREDFWLRGLIQTSAPINPGNSGGPLLNINGELIGINTAIRQQAQNIGFAIPVDTLTENLIEMLMPEKLRRVRLGVVIGKMTHSQDRRVEGLKVMSVTPGSPAANKGLKEGDLITKVDGSRLVNFIDFYVKIMDKEVGDSIELDCIRSSDGKSRTLTLNLEHRPIPDGGEICRKFFQMEISDLDSNTARKFDFDSEYPVLIITEVAEGGAGDQAGFKEGDILLSVNSSPVETMKQFSLQMEKIQEGDTVSFEILRIGFWGSTQVQKRYRLKLEAKQQSDIAEKIIL